MGDPVLKAVTAPGLDVTVYLVMADDPVNDGAVKETIADRLAGDATTLVGGPGTLVTVVGVTAADGADAIDVPIGLVAVTVNVYDVPLVKPVTAIGDTAREITT